MQNDNALDKWDGKTDFIKQIFTKDSEYILRLEERLKYIEKKVVSLEKQIQDLELDNEGLREQLAGDDW